MNKREERYYKNTHRDKLPRKTKKMILGRKLSQSALKRKIKNIQIETASLSNGYTWPVPSEEFCPKCGCRETRSSGNMAGYPEVYEIAYCLRCDSYVGRADNSQFIHVLVDIKYDH